VSTSNLHRIRHLASRAGAVDAFLDGNTRSLCEISLLGMPIEGQSFARSQAWAISHRSVARLNRRISNAASERGLCC
jgi:hypothetical protein